LARRQNDVHREVDQFRRQAGESLVPILGGSKLDQRVLAFDVALLFER